jgi:hypothetical protein
MKNNNGGDERASQQASRRRPQQKTDINYMKRERGGLRMARQGQIERTIIMVIIALIAIALLVITAMKLLRSYG